jgi:hypothetical protein
MPLPGSRSHAPSPRCPSIGPVRQPHLADSRADRLYFPNAEYPRGFAGGIALKLHCFFPHLEHRILFSTSVNFASQPQSLPNVCGSAVRSCPHAEHLSTNVYWPNSSLSLFTRNSRAMARIVTSQNRSVHPVLEQRRYCIENYEGQADGTESYSSRHIPTLLSCVAATFPLMMPRSSASSTLSEPNGNFPQASTLPPPTTSPSSG